MANHPNAETHLITHFCNTVKTGRLPVISHIGQDLLQANQLTMARLLDRVYENIPIDFSLAGEGSLNLARAPSPMSRVARSDRRSYTPEQMRAHISNLTADKRAMQAEINRLQDELHALKTGASSSSNTPRRPNSHPDGGPRRQGPPQHQSGRSGNPRRRRAEANMGEDEDLAEIFLASESGTTFSLSFLLGVTISAIGLCLLGMIVAIVGLDDLSAMFANVSVGTWAKACGTFGSLGGLGFLKILRPEHTGKCLAVFFLILAAAIVTHVDGKSHLSASVNLSAAADQYTPMWCVDCGANRNITPNVMNFSTYRTINLSLSVAKQNTTMQAIGIGTCIIHCVDNSNLPCKLELQNVLHVPLASRSLLSTSALSSQGYQAVLPSQGALFPPGLYLPRSGTSTKAPRYIPFDTVNGLHYIATRHDCRSSVPSSSRLSMMPLCLLVNLVIVPYRLLQTRAKWSLALSVCPTRNFLVHLSLMLLASKKTRMLLDRLRHQIISLALMKYGMLILLVR